MVTMDDSEISFAPHAAINEFMRADFRQQVLANAFRNLNLLAEEQRSRLIQMLRANVQVQGFRNPLKAPEIRMAKGAEKFFENNSIFAAHVLQAWFVANKELAVRVSELLISSGWQILPLEADRTQMPGFFITWPKGFDFDQINALYNQKNPDLKFSTDEVSLMTVWISMRLPYGESDDPLNFSQTE
jgi:hypothetical protein